MSFKSGTSEILQQLISWVETQFDCHIKTLQSDNGTEIFPKQDYFLCQGN